MQRLYPKIINHASRHNNDTKIAENHSKSLMKISLQPTQEAFNGLKAVMLYKNIIFQV